MAKGSFISLEAILGIIFALIIIVPIVLLVSNFTSTSGQATDNFQEFTGALESMSHSENTDDRKSHLLIMDDLTMITYFTDRMINVQVDTTATTLSSYSIYIERPAACTKTPCICLIQEAEVETIPAQSSVKVSPLKSTCNELTYTVSYKAGDNQCGIGESTNGASYTCSGGWFIDRGLIKDELLVSAYFSVQRRTPLILGPIEDGVQFAQTRKELK